jgi:hypothetical protein
MRRERLAGTENEQRKRSNDYQDRFPHDVSSHRAVIVILWISADVCQIGVKVVHTPAAA